MDYHRFSFFGDELMDVWHVRKRLARFCSLWVLWWCSLEQLCSFIPESHNSEQKWCIVSLVRTNNRFSRSRRSNYLMIISVFPVKLDSGSKDWSAYLVYSIISKGNLQKRTHLYYSMIHFYFQLQNYDRIQSQCVTYMSQRIDCD